MNRLDYLIDYLLKEDPQYSEMQIPDDLQSKRDLFRALCNVRWPKPYYLLKCAREHGGRARGAIKWKRAKSRNFSKAKKAKDC